MWSLFHFSALAYSSLCTFIQQWERVWNKLKLNEAWIKQKTNKENRSEHNFSCCWFIRNNVCLCLCVCKQQITTHLEEGSFSFKRKRMRTEENKKNQRLNLLLLMHWNAIQSIQSYIFYILREFMTAKYVSIVKQTTNVSLFWFCTFRHKCASSKHHHSVVYCFSSIFRCDGTAIERKLHAVHQE